MDWLNSVVEWATQNWPVIRVVLEVVVGVVMWVFVQNKGDLKKLASMVWAGLQEMAHQGLSSVSRDEVYLLAGAVYAEWADTIPWFLRAFITKERVQQAAWTTWEAFLDAVSAPNKQADKALASYHRNEFAMVQLAMSRVAGGRPQIGALPGVAARITNRIRFSTPTTLRR